MIKRIFQTLLFFCSLQVFCQSEFKIELKNSETNEPISYATIRFKNTNRGLIADYDGQFRLPYNLIDSIPNLMITALGYKPINIITKELKLSEINIIKMHTQIESLETVVINIAKKDAAKSFNISKKIDKNKKLLASDIVRKAIKQIPNNLSAKPHSYMGYYRDYQIIDSEYYNLKEGILEQYDNGIKSHKIASIDNQGVFYSYNDNNDFKVSTHFAKAYDGFSKYIDNANIVGFGGNELTILNVHNPIRNYDRNSFSYVYQLNKNFINNHKFSKSNIFFNGEEPVVNIIFDSKRKNENTKTYNRVISSLTNESIDRKKIFKVRGKISISLIDYSILNFSYTMLDEDKNNPLFNVSIEYKKVNNKMYLNYISFNNRFKVAEEHTFDNQDIIFNKRDKIFKITLNNTIDFKTVKKRNFRIKYNGSRISIKSIDSVSSNTIHLKINDYTKALDNIEGDMGNLALLLKGIKDSRGREIYKSEMITAYQFREFFVQEVFHDKKLNENLKFINKTKPLYEAPVNKVLKNSQLYIVNTPLKTRRVK